MVSKMNIFKACEAGDLDRVRILIENGEDINCGDLFGRTPLHCARSVEIARYLVEQGADINCKNNDGHYPFQHALHYFISGPIRYFLINKLVTVYSEHPSLTRGEFPPIISWNRITSENWTEPSHLSHKK